MGCDTVKSSTEAGRWIQPRVQELGGGGLGGREKKIEGAEDRVWGWWARAWDRAWRSSVREVSGEVVSGSNWKRIVAISALQSHAYFARKNVI